MASITKLWLFTKMRKLNIHRVDLDLHEKYGEIVRVAPNQVHISDPAFVKPIYGALSKFRKSDWYSKPIPSVIIVRRHHPDNRLKG